MIRLDRVELLHWDIQAHQVLPLSRGVTVLTGENGSGKTSVLDAIKVGLGGELGGDRSVRSYLLKQAAPVAMIRILVDNRAEPGTRRRPFDPLGEQSQDLVTLAVVFRATAESDYNIEYYILDGDTVPLDKNPRHRALPTRRDYQARLQKVGIGRQYLRLLSLAQGQIASFCRKSGSALFDDLFDIIGGRQALESWVERIKELSEARAAVVGTERDLREATRHLETLLTKVRRHEDFLKKARKVDSVRRAEPWARWKVARGDADVLSGQIAAAQADWERQDRLAREAEAEGARLATALTSLDEGMSAVQARRRALDEEQRRVFKDSAVADARHGELDRLRVAAAGVPELDPAPLRAQVEAVATSLAEGGAIARGRASERRVVDEELATVAKGLLPYPSEVQSFTAALRRAGLPHHLLAEVVEVEDQAWRPAVEAWLGRLRFAVLVQDPAAWPEAAALARAHRYPHGVLAPDVRGSSPADADGLFARLTVREPRYRALIARLVRHVELGEPKLPFAPLRVGEQLAPDGFTLSRAEARTAAAPGRWLGRAALEDHRQRLEAKRAELDAADAAWARDEADLRRAKAAAELAVAAQERRLAWEAVRDEHAATRAEVERLRGEEAAILAQLREAEADRIRIDAERQPLAELRGQAANQATIARRERTEAELRGVSLRPKLEEAEAELGQLRATLPEQQPDADVAAVLDEGLPLAAMRSLLRDLDVDLAGFSAEERDSLLPVNAQRQQGEVEAVRRRLGELRDGLEQTESAAKAARDQYEETTRRIFRSYWGRLRDAAAQLDFTVEGQLRDREDGRFACEVRVRVGDKPPVHHDSEDLSGGQKAALSILMGMTAVSLESASAGFFLIDEPFSASDVHKINELGSFLGRTDAQYLLSMPTSSDLDRCGPWLEAVWLCTRSRGGVESDGRVRLAPPLKLAFVSGADGA